MERQTGLGRSLGDVLDSLTPAEPEPMTEAARALFEPEAVEERLEALTADVAVLRRRVRRLERMVPKDAPDADVGTPDADARATSPERGDTAAKPKAAKPKKAKPKKAKDGKAKPKKAKDGKAKRGKTRDAGAKDAKPKK